MEIDEKNNNKIKKYENILKKIFLFSEEENKYYPKLINANNNNMVELFNFLLNDNFIEVENCLKCMLNIFKQSLEIAFQICASNYDYDNKRNYNFIKLLMDIYIKIDEKNQEIIIQLISFLFKNIEIKKNIYDYPLNNLLQEYKNKQLSTEKFLKYINLLSLFFIKNNEITIQPKNYFYFTDNSHLGINIKFPSPNIQIDNGFSLEINFYLNENKKNEKSLLFELITQDDQRFEVLISETNNLEVLFNSKKIESLSVPIKKGCWNIIKFTITTSKRKNYPEIIISISDNFKDFQIKTYQLDNKFSNEVEFSFANFFKFFEGKFTSIILYSGEKEDIINYLYGIYTKKQLIEFLNNNNKNEFLIKHPIFFILTPISFDLNNYIITDPINRIKAQFPKPKNPNNFNNYVKLYHNSSNNIFNLGGINVLLPIFEIIYKDFQEKNCFKSVIYLINDIINDKNKNIINALTSDFFSILSLFLERINDSLFTSDIIKKFIEIGKNILNLNDDNFKLNQKEFFNKILFNFKIIKKYPPELLSELWGQTLLNYNSIIEIFPSLPNISPFITSYYLNNNFDKNLFEILKIVLNHKDTSDNDRIIFFKILSTENLSIDLIMLIIDLFNNYFHSDENGKPLRQKSLINMLEYNCLNELIYGLSNLKQIVKIKIIDFMIFITSEYNDIIKKFFEKCQVKSNGKIIYKFLGKKDLLDLIKNNIIINENNKEIIKQGINIPNITKRFLLDRSESVIINIDTIKNKFLKGINEEQSIKIKKTNTILKEEETKKNTQITNRNNSISLNNNLNKNNNKQNNNFETIEAESRRKIPKIQESLDSNSESSNNKSNEGSIKSNKSHDKIIKSISKEIEIDEEEKNSPSNPLTSKNSKKLNFDFSIEVTNGIIENNNKGKNNLRRMKSKSSNSIIKDIGDCPINIDINKISIPFKKTKSQNLNFDYSSLEINVDKINKESELKNNNFHNKVFLLAKHCVDYLNGIDNENECKSSKYEIYSLNEDNNNNNKNINYKKGIKKSTIDTINEDENEGSISNTISKRNTFNDNSSNNNLIHLEKKIKESLSNTIDDKENSYNESNNNTINKSIENSITPKELKFESPVKEDNKELEKNNFHIATLLCNWLHSIKKNINLLNNENNKNNIYVIDFLIFQCKSLKNIKLILNIISYLSINKPISIISSQNSINLSQNEIWKNETQMLFKNEDFIYFIIDISFNCYLLINISQFKSPLNNNGEKIDFANFNKTYSICRDLLIDIYFNNFNDIEEKSSNYIILSYLFRYLLNFRFNNNYNKDGIYNHYSFTFFREILKLIIDKYYDILNKEQYLFFNKKNKKTPWINFIKFISLFFEFSILFQYSEKIYNTKENLLDIKESNISKIPSYIIRNVFYSVGTDKLWSDYHNYQKLYNIIKYIWSRERIYKLCSIDFDNNEYKVYNISNNDFEKIIENILFNKEKINEIQSYYEILFISFNKKIKDINGRNIEYFLPLINIISILTSYLISSISRKEELENLKYWLNNYQFFLIFLLIGSCNLNIKKKILDKYDYKFVSKIIYSNLAFNIGFIFSNFYKENNNDIKSLYHIVIKNICRIYSKLIKIIDIKKERIYPNNILTFKKRIELTENSAILLLNKVYIPQKNIKKNIKQLDNQLQKNQKIVKSIFTLIEYTSKDYMSLKYLNDNKQMFENTLCYNQNIHNDLLFDTKMYKNIFNYEFNQKNNIESLLIENENNYTPSYPYNYRKLIENINNDYKYLEKYIFEKSEYQNLIETLNNKKKYRKIKKELFTWNNTYSDFNIFYSSKNSLKYKLKYHLTKDLTTPILSPILDIEYYFPTFTKYNKQNIFEENYRKYYNIDLKIFPIETPSVSIIDYNDFKCCIILTTHHIKGGIKFYNDYFEFIPIISNDENILFPDRDEEYQSEKKSCYGSIFKTNNNYKDFLFIRQFEINNINFIFKRKYFYRDNSVELFLNTNKTFYFKFITNKIRDEFINKIISQKKYPFIEIKSIDRKIIGYYKNIPKYKDIFSNIDNLSNNWKNWKMSNLEYLMWLNIFGNRSYRDINQYPIMPWILTNYLNDTNEFNEILKNEKEDINGINNYLIKKYLRDFNCPIGLFSFNKEGKKRKEVYKEVFRSMILELIQEKIIDLNQNNKEKLENTKDDDDDINEEVDTKKKNNILTYGIDIESLYNNPKINYDKIPYYFGSHFSNGTYVSHYLVRIFPFSLTSIEIQVDNFDTPDRLFFNLGRTFNNVSCEKCDVRELIPQFFCLPEMFENINKLNLGYLQDSDEDENIENNNIDIKINNKKIKNKEDLRVEDVYLPNWAKNNRNYFIMKMREILEDERLKINQWVNIIFGIYQFGNEALKIGNIFCSYCYDNIMNIRLDNYIKNKQFDEVRCILCLFELGVHPIKVLKNEKERKEKNKIKNEKLVKFDFFYSKCNEINDGNNKLTKDPIFISSFKDKINNIGIENLMVILSDFQKIQISFAKINTNINENNKYNIKSDSKVLSTIIQNLKFLYRDLLILAFKENSFFIITGFIDGKILLIKNENNNKEIKQYDEIRISNPLISKQDNSLITYITKDEDEEFIYAGTQNGSIIIYKNENSFSNIDSITFLKIINNHTKPIIHIHSNSRLNMFIDCSSDCYINIYTMSKIELIKSIYSDNSYDSLINYVFLSSSPLPSFILYTSKNMFNCYNINGELLDIICEENIGNNPHMISPIFITDSNFMDYLIYGTINNYVFIRKFPYMNLIKCVNLKQNLLIENLLYLPNDNDDNDDNLPYKQIKFLYVSKNGQFVYVIYDNSNLINIIPLNLNI